MSDSPPECLRCGACCFNDNPTALRVTGDDRERLGDALAEAFTHFVGHRCYLRVVDDHCAALQVRPDGSFVCALYEQRPQVCRDLARGSPACNAERWEKVHRTVDALRRVRASGL